MIPLTVNPKVVVFINPHNGVESVQAVASNVDPDVNVVIVHSHEEYADAMRGLPFDSANPNPQTQVLAAKH
jgi:two-component SAPR family response regulator